MPIFKATDLTDAKAISFSAKDLTDAAPTNSLEDMTRTSTPTPAQSARARLASRGLTPEAVKAGQGISPLPTDIGPRTPIVRPILQGIGVPTSMDELKQEALHNAPNMLLPGSTQSLDFINDLSTGHIPIIGRTAEALSAPTHASIQNRPQTPDENAGAIRAAAGTIPTLAMMSPTFRGAVGKASDFSMPKTAANLINHWLGDGAIDTTLRKDAGRGISQAKIVATSADGVQEGVRSAITKRQAQKADLLNNPLAQAPTINGTKLIEEAFGEPPLNIPKATLKHWNEFASNLMAKVQDISGGTGNLSPAQVDSLKNEIDVDFGRLSTDATELNLNQKSGSVRRAFDKAVDNSVPGYAELNDHLADLHHANKLLTKKIAENATAPPMSINPRAVLRGVMSDAVKPGGPQGTRPGILTTPGRTALASLLSKRPNIPVGAGVTMPDPSLLSEDNTSSITTTPEGSVTTPPPEDSWSYLDTPAIYREPTATASTPPPKINLKTETKVADLTSNPAAVRPEIVEANRQHNSNATKILNEKYPLGDSAGVPPRIFKAAAPPKISEDTTRTPEAIFADMQKVDSALSEAVTKNLAARELASKTMRGLEATPNGGRPKGSVTVKGEPVEFVSTKEASKRKDAIVAGPQDLVNTLRAQRDSLYKEMETVVQPKAETQAPTKPTHVTEGTQVSGIDEQGNLVSGNLEKLYPVVGEDGQPIWKGTILDLRNSRTMDLPADRLFDRLSGPPKSTIPPKPRAATTPAPIAPAKSKLDSLLDQFDDELPEAEDPKQAELERKAQKASPPTKKVISEPPLDKGAAAKKAVQDWLDKKALMEMEEQLGAGKRKPKGKR